MTTEIQGGTVARHCKPSTLDAGQPKASCFTLRKDRDERELSVYLLDYFRNPTEKENVIAVKQLMEKRGFKFGLTSIFATLDIDESKRYILAEIAQKIVYRQTGTPPHCSLFHQYHNDLLVAKLLSKCVKNCYSVKQL